MASLQSQIDDLERKLQDARRQGERSDQRAERAERALRDAEMQLVEAERCVLQVCAQAGMTRGQFCAALLCSPDDRCCGRCC